MLIISENDKSPEAHFANSVCCLLYTSINAICDIFRAKVVDVAKSSMIIELTGDQGKLSAFLELIRDYEILELARTGMTGLSRGADDVRYL